jgi:hypothetical protein
MFRRTVGIINLTIQVNIIKKHMKEEHHNEGSLGIVPVVE